MLTLKSPEIADAALPDRAEPYRRLDTAVLEALILKGALGMSDEDIDHLTQLGYARDAEQALELVPSGEYDAAFLMAPTADRAGPGGGGGGREHAAEVDVFLSQSPHRAGLQPARVGHSTDKRTARRTNVRPDATMIAGGKRA